MRSILLLTCVVFSHGSKLDNTYLPPASAQSAGGSSLETPKPTPGLANGILGQYNYAGNYGQNAGILGQYNEGLNAQYNEGLNGQFGRINGNYNNLPLGQYSSGSYQQPISNFDNYNSFAANFRPERPQAVFERNAAILRYDNVNNVDNYAYRYETSNGIAAEETGIATNGVVAQGGFSYLGDDGRQYTVRYTADENGFRPVGDHLPTPPPIPEAILRSLEQNARDEAAGIYDDGSYKENLYGEKRGYNYPAANLANLQAIRNIEQNNIQAQAINLWEQTKQAQAINNAVQANIQAQTISQLEQAKQVQAINHAGPANIQDQVINHAVEANIQAQAISQLEQNKQAQAVNLWEQAKQAEAINHAVQANIQAQAISQLEQAKQAQAVNHAVQANIQAQAINQLEQVKHAQAISNIGHANVQAANNLGHSNVQTVNNLDQAKSTVGSKSYLPPKSH